MRLTALSGLVPDPAGFLAAPPRRPAIWSLPAPPPFCLADVDALLDHGSLHRQMVSVVTDGRRVPGGTYTWSGRPVQPGFADVVRPARLTTLLRDGSTVVLESLHRTWPPVGDLCRRLSWETGLPVGANAYLTPAGSQGFAHHHDTHAVLIVQTSGSKTWQVHAPVLTDPLEHQPFRAERVSDADWARLRHGTPQLETVLRVGDALWIPRGWVHNGFATDEHSLHLSLAFPALTGHWIATQLLARLDAVEELRAEVPWGFCADPRLRARAVATTVAQLRAALNSLDPAADAEVMADAYRRFFLEPRTPAATAAILPGLAEDTPVRTVAEAVCGVTALDGGGLRLHLGAFTVEFEEPAAAVVAALLTADDPEPWCAADLVPGLDAADATELVTDLVRIGVARPATAGT
ncbi:cupin domain-containing protein [Longispora sp. K20-0274]|uniref:cupin domain-containing protein n=1 Tax=Longispora sp. K20-0274 TaxID=3088255 RepID=UPI00399964D8